MKSYITIFVIMTFLLLMTGCATQKGSTGTTNVNDIHIEDAGDNPDAGSMNTVSASADEILPDTAAGTNAVAGGAVTDIPDLAGDNPDTGSTDSLDVSTDQIV